uniref:C2H2-type domain-containing protein n=1 Tax=Erpetoichthys calabaricus TaxID=27687 RepID=A0A8C4TEY6_ERPCA
MPLLEFTIRPNVSPYPGSLAIFQCTICSKTFRVQRYLNMHLKTHATERIMQCEHCRQCFETTHSNSLQCQHKYRHSRVFATAIQTPSFFFF